VYVERYMRVYGGDDQMTALQAPPPSIHVCVRVCVCVRVRACVYSISIFIFACVIGFVLSTFVI
jgi:hypothetical protein